MTPRATAAALLGLSTLSACLHLPPSREVREGEVVELDAISVRLPSGPGWTVRHVALMNEEVVTLRHMAADGQVDRQAQVAQTKGTPQLAVLLEEGGGNTVRLRPAGAAAAPRFGPLSAHLTYRTEPVPGATGPAGTYSSWLFAAPARMDRGYRVSWYERDAASPDAGGEEARAGRAEAFFDAVRVRRTGEAPVPSTPPQVAIRPGLGLTMGGAGFRVMGRSLAGLDERLWFGLDRLEPGPRRGTGWDFGLRLLATPQGQETAAVALLTPSAFWAWGPARLRAGVDMGVAVVESRTTPDKRQRLLAGGTAGASFDLHRGERFDWLLDAEGSLGAQRFQAAGLRLGVRFH
ncbi:MAG TPA: hypothetical protein VFP50_00990 [Anaeromyxobacteraceae bacterium]|nr:hypothetical protein [Anaeromyxobacteraceae bacterium]